MAPDSLPTGPECPRPAPIVRYSSKRAPRCVHAGAPKQPSLAEFGSDIGGEGQSKDVPEEIEGSNSGSEDSAAVVGIAVLSPGRTHSRPPPTPDGRISIGAHPVAVTAEGQAAEAAERLASECSGAATSSRTSHSSAIARARGSRDRIANRAASILSMDGWTILGAAGRLARRRKRQDDYTASAEVCQASAPAVATATADDAIPGYLAEARASLNGDPKPSAYVRVSSQVRKLMARSDKDEQPRKLQPSSPEVPAVLPISSPKQPARCPGASASLAAAAPQRQLTRQSTRQTMGQPSARQPTVRRVVVQERVVDIRSEAGAPVRTCNPAFLLVALICFSVVGLMIGLSTLFGRGVAHNSSPSPPAAPPAPPFMTNALVSGR